MAGKRHIILTTCALCLVMALAVLVRIPWAFASYEKIVSEPFTDKDSLPYLNQMDGYYHLRMAEEIAQTGSFGTVNAETGKRVDTLRFAPEGRKASYHAGIIYIAIGIWKILRVLCGVSLHEAAFYLSCVFAALTALAAFFLTKKISNTAGGVFGAVFVACAPAFVGRTAAGSFDTDMTQLLFTILMMLTMAETLKAKTHRRAVVFAAVTAAIITAFTFFWSSSSLLFAAIMYMGGAVSLLLLLAAGRRARRGSILDFLKSPAFAGYIVSAAATVLLLLVTQGVSFIRSFFGGLTAGSSGKTILPNLLQSVEELQKIPFGPNAFTDWFRGFIPGRTTVVNGVGGLLVLLLGLGGILLLSTQALRLLRKTEMPVPENAVQGGFVNAGIHEDACGQRVLVYHGMTAIWFLACLYGLRRGMRFVEHFAAPAGILAGSAAGILFERAAGYLLKKREAVKKEITEKNGNAEEKAGSRYRKSCAAAAVCMTAAAVLSLFAAYMSVDGAIMECRYTTPSVTDASENAMQWIAQKAETEDAVIASWWDMGYYYEYEARHPTLWDGGSQNAVRAIIMGKALTAADLQQSRALLRMLSETGNKAAIELAGSLGARTGFEALWETVALEKKETLQRLEKVYGLEPDRAAQIETLLHPKQTKEIYLVLSGAMIMRLGLFEYYAGWDFTGTQKLPAATAFFAYPDGSGSISGESGDDTSFLEYRKSETIWKLYLERTGTDQTGEWFEKVFEEGDGQENVQVWHAI